MRQMLLDCNANLNSIDKDGNNLLKIAADNGHRRVAEFIAKAMGLPMPHVEKSSSVGMRSSLTDCPGAEAGDVNLREGSYGSSRKSMDGYDAEKERRKEAQKARRKWRSESTDGD